MAGLVNAFDIVAHANVLYVSEYRDKLIHRIQLSDETSSKWSVNGGWLRMSINEKGNVVVSCFDLNKIIEYTPTGSCLREIKVNAIDENYPLVCNMPFNWTTIGILSVTQQQSIIGFV